MELRSLEYKVDNLRGYTDDAQKAFLKSLLKSFSWQTKILQVENDMDGDGTVNGCDALVQFAAGFDKWINDTRKFDFEWIMVSGSYEGDSFMIGCSSDLKSLATK